MIWRDLKWEQRIPTLLLETTKNNQATGQVQRIPLHPGSFLGITTATAELEAAGISTQKFCAGYAHALNHTTGFTTVPCPQHALLSTGKQCRVCQGLDEFSAIHGIHRGAVLTPAAQAYASIEHWLYIATFPDGSSKVGTASAHSKTRRLDEQAVATATYIGKAHDGRQVRIWEDLVSTQTGLVQAKLVSTKYRAWTKPLPAERIKIAHQQAVALANWSLQETVLLEPEFIAQEQIISERWVPSIAMNRAYSSLASNAPQPLAAYPSLLGSTHGFYINGATGKFLTAHFGDPDCAFMINTAQLNHRAVLPYDQLTAQPHTQNSLF